jgi:hypothetical protein
MSYIEHSLGRSENLLYKAHFPWFYHAGGWAALLGLVAGGIVAHANGYDGPAAALILAGLALFLTIMVPIWTTEIGVTTQRFIYKRGLVWRRTQELQLRAIEEVNLQQDIPGRMLGFGHLELHGTGVDDIRLPALADPLGLRRALQDGMAAAAQAQAAAPGPPRASPTAAEG